MTDHLQYAQSVYNSVIHGDITMASAARELGITTKELMGLLREEMRRRHDMSKTNSM